MREGICGLVPPEMQYCPPWYIESLLSQKLRPPIGSLGPGRVGLMFNWGDWPGQAKGRRRIGTKHPGSNRLPVRFHRSKNPSPGMESPPYSTSRKR